jgi:hypothetical protein
LLIAELADNEGWDLLANLAEAMGHDDMAQSFRDALEVEETHLDDVRRWVAAIVGDTSHADVAGSMANPP